MSGMRTVEQFEAYLKSLRVVTKGNKEDTYKQALSYKIEQKGKLEERFKKILEGIKAERRELLRLENIVKRALKTNHKYLEKLIEETKYE